MSTFQKVRPVRLRHPANAYRFLFEALRHTQESLGRSRAQSHDDDEAHISGQELLDGVRDYARRQFGLMALVVFHSWGIHSTDDFGRMVFELIERGEMRKTEHDQLSDFFNYYSFEEEFGIEHPLELDLTTAFR